MAIRSAISICATLLVLSGAPSVQHGSQATGMSSTSAPQFTLDGKLKLPEDYRAWAYVTTGFDMSYSERGDHSNAVFDNVFVQPEAYDHFVRTRTWPDKTMFILELRQSSDHGSILKNGRFQGSISGIEASIKDESRFPEKWAYFDFGPTATEAAPFPKEARCFTCHKQNGAVDNTFVQFYPTLGIR
jgi:hypothetical protein